ncbi:hypothetical protein CI109_102402 [Kwoniella shandongensis]|uniref:Uncharacterized protein n=1 Tax=Kwoniella shandongensis TaxID=1734106 RepID=A0A5M6C5B9_9TREE|nr:uncharacterized protein CI109_003279 [Kwoniella shandongensis]KAA5528379.1 hypothetical protein CI109_003279 [Kwoniella shandongensis]
MLVHVLALLSAAGLVVNAASIPLRPRQAANSTLATQSTYIACVADTKIPSLTSSVATSATSREECSNTCSQDNWEIAYFRQDTSQCYCSPASDYPTSDEVVYAVDDQGNCRSEDDASVEYLHSPYALSGCYLYLTSEPISNVTASSPLDCLNSCNTTSIAIRPELDSPSNQFVYECQCFGGEIGLGQVTDCGYGVEGVYQRI